MGSPKKTVSVLTIPLHCGHRGGISLISSSSRFHLVLQDMQRNLLMFPWISARFLLPAFRCRSSMFWVMRHFRIFISSSSARAWCPGLGFASQIFEVNSPIDFSVVFFSMFSHQPFGSARNLWYPSMGGSPYLVQIPPGPRKGGIPLSTETPAPVSPMAYLLAIRRFEASSSCSFNLSFSSVKTLDHLSISVVARIFILQFLI